MDLPETEDILVFFLLLAWACLSLTNRALKNLELESAFPMQSVMANLMQRIPLEFAPGLLQVLRSPTPPTISYFKTLSLRLDKLWAVYLLVLEHEDPARLPRIYIGSGTEVEYRIRRRMGVYDSLRSVPGLARVLPMMAAAIISRSTNRSELTARTLHPRRSTVLLPRESLPLLPDMKPTENQAPKLSQQRRARRRT